MNGHAERGHLPRPMLATPSPPAPRSRADLELQESLIKFNKFLQENEFKRQRALRRAEEEEAQWRKKDEEIQRLRKQLDEMQALSQALQQTLDRNIRTAPHSRTAPRCVAPWCAAGVSGAP